MKRFFDIVVSGILLIVLLPIFALIGLIVRYSIGSPVFFKQKRAGIYGKSFEVIKFRTMTLEKDSSNQLLPDAERITTMGKFLRSTSLDELPELWNVLRGEMSLVGPRPLLCEYLPLYSEHHQKRHQVSPGITGWAQINGRNKIEWADQFDMDVWYVENQSFLLDLRIIFKTAFKLASFQKCDPMGESARGKFTGDIKHDFK